MAGEDVKVTFGAQSDQLVDAFKKIKEQAATLPEIFKQVESAFAAFLAVLAGGEAFKEAISHTEELIDTTRRFMYQTGMAADEAQAMIQALKQSDSSAEAYTSTLLRMQLRLTSNAEIFQAYGVKTKDASGALLSADQIFRNVIGTLEGMRVGADRNQVSLQLLGRSARDIEPFMRTMKVDLEEVKALQEKLGLVVTDNSILMKDRYSDAVERVKMVMSGVEKVMAEQMMPRLTELGEKFVDLGPDIVDGAGAAMLTFLDILEAVGATVRDMWHAVEDAGTGIAKVLRETFGIDGTPMTGLEFFKNMLTVIRIAVLTVRTAISLGFEQMSYYIDKVSASARVLINTFVAFETSRHPIDDAVAAWKKGNDEIADLERKHYEKMAGIIAEGDAKLDKLVTGSGGAGDYSHGGKGGRAARPQSGSGRAKDFKQGGLAQAEAAMLKAEEAARLAILKEGDKEELAALDELYKNKIISIGQYYDAKEQIDLKANQQELDAQNRLFDELEQAKTKASGKSREQEVLKINAEEAKIIGQIIVLEKQRGEITRASSRERAAAEQAENDALAQIESKRKEAAATAGVSAQDAQLKQRVAMLQVTVDEELEEERRLEQKRYEITQKALDDRQALVHLDAQKQAQLNADREAAELAHQQKLTDIDYKAELERNKLTLEFRGGFSTALQTMLVDLGQHTKSMGDIFRTFVLSIGKLMEELVAKRFVERMFGAGTAGGNAIDALMKPIFSAFDSLLTTVLEFFGVTVSTSKTAGIAQVTTNAAVAATAAMGSVAAIPFYGWAMAPEVGAETYGLAMAFLPSAEKGYWEIPNDTLAQVHKEEMVIPREEARGLRELVQGGGGAGGAINIYAHDSKSFDAYLQGPAGDVLIKRLKRANRDFKTRGFS